MIGDRAPVLGVDIGGSKIEMALVGADSTVLARLRTATDRMLSPAQFVVDLANAARREFGAQLGGARAVGIGVAAQVDTTRGWLHFAPNLGWRGVSIGALAESAFALPIVLTNDVRAATAGEWRHGAGRGCSELVCLLVGTGIGGGVVTGGRLVTGCAGIAGELGHLKIVVGGRRCSCGDTGCLEAYAGGWAITQRARAAVLAAPDAGAALLRAAGHAERMEARHVSALYGAGDPLAIRLIEETVEALGAGVASVVNALNPCRVILGGGVIEGLPALVDLVAQRVARAALPSAARGLVIVPAHLGALAGAIGAAVLAAEDR